MSRARPEDSPAPPFLLEPLDGPSAVPRLTGADLSDWFNPFLGRFATEAMGSGGGAVVATQDRRVLGLLLTDPAERLASVFARSPAVVRELLREAGTCAVYTEADLGDPREEFGIFVADLGGAPVHRFRHPVHVVDDRQLPQVAEFLKEAYGPSAGRWVTAAAQAGEVCLAVEVDGALAGIAWVLVVGAVARLHTLLVRPGFRRTRVGTDLLLGRLWYGHQAGARRAISEISEHNLASRAVAAAGGMAPRGRMYLYPPGRPAQPGPRAGPAVGFAPTTG